MSKKELTAGGCIAALTLGIMLAGCDSGSGGTPVKPDNSVVAPEPGSRGGSPGAGGATAPGGGGAANAPGR